MKSKRWIVALVAVIVIVLAAVAFVLLFAKPVSEHRPVPPPAETTGPAETTSGIEPTTTTSTVEPTSSAGPSLSAKPWRSASPVLFVRDDALWKVREDGRGTADRLVTFADTATYLLSPDRRLVAFTRPAGRIKPLYVLDLSTGDEMKVASTTDALQGFPYTWSPSGDWLAYTVPLYSGSTRVGEDIFVASPDGSRRKLLAKQAGAPEWGSADTVVFRRVDVRRGTWRLWTIRITGGTAATLVPASSQAGAYDWAPNRADLAFGLTEKSTAGPLSSVKILKAGESSPETVLQERLVHATYTKIAWSPDGRQIAVTRGGDDGYSRVGVIDLATGTTWEVNPKRDTYVAGWTADGSRLLYVEGNFFQGAPSNLWSVKRNGTSRRIVVTDAALR